MEIKYVYYIPIVVQQQSNASREKFLNTEACARVDSGCWTWASHAAATISNDRSDNES